MQNYPILFNCCNSLNSNVNVRTRKCVRITVCKILWCGFTFMYCDVCCSHVARMSARIFLDMNIAELENMSLHTIRTSLIQFDPPPSLLTRSLQKLQFWGTDKLWRYLIWGVAKGIPPLIVLFKLACHMSLEEVGNTLTRPINLSLLSCFHFWNVINSEYRK